MTSKKLDYNNFKGRFKIYLQKEIMFSRDMKAHAIKGEKVSLHKLTKIIGVDARYGQMVQILVDRHSEPKEKFKQSKIDFDAFITEYYNLLQKIYETNS
jgi:phosphotransferase system HPr-like phosphotransfer protein